MRLDINGSNVARGAGIRRHIEGEVSRWLAVFAPRIGTVRVRLLERAPAEATRMLCGIGVTLEPRDEAAAAWVLARAEENDAHQAVSHAVERIARAVAEEIARRDREQALHTRALRAFVERGSVKRV